MSLCRPSPVILFLFPDARNQRTSWMLLIQIAYGYLDSVYYSGIIACDFMNIHSNYSLLPQAYQ